MKEIDKMDIIRKNKLIDMACRMRRLAIEMAYAANKNGAHLGGGLSLIEIMAVLYGEVMNVDASQPNSENRDIFLLSKAHGVLAYYTALYEKGFISREDIDSFEKEGSDFIGHPIRNIEKGIEYSGGSLGMALSVAVGYALSFKMKKNERKVYVVLGDGECQEGSNWEAFFAAYKYKLNNLIIIIDNNGLQSDGKVEEISGISDLGQMIASFGGDVRVVDGHNVEELYNELMSEIGDSPKVIIANTIKGKGVSFMENNYVWHHGILSEKQFRDAMDEVTK